MAKYEIWKKQNLSNRRGQAEASCYTLDVAMLKACELSAGSSKQSVWNPKKKNPNPSPWSSAEGDYEEIDVPNACAVVERGDKQSHVRGWGLGGVWKDAKDCKRCNNSGQDVNSWNEPCSSCKGASFRPKV
jgi:hypothetical protein